MVWFQTSNNLLKVELIYLKFGLTKGESHLILNSLPNTDLRLDHLFFFCHFGSSFFKLSIWVSSEKIAEICVQNITRVNMPNRSEANPKIITSIRVAGGEKLEHWNQSLSTHLNIWQMIMNPVWNEIKHMYNFILKIRI